MPDAWEHFNVDVAEAKLFYQQMLDLRAEYVRLARLDPTYGPRSERVKEISKLFSQDLEAIARKVAVEADRAIKARLRATTWRPPTGNRPGLLEGVKSMAEPTGPFSFGSVAVAEVAALESVVGEVTGKPYWWTQEYGSRHNIGRVIHGTFFGGAGAPGVPSQLQFRQHSVFVGGPRGIGTIRRGIPAKHYLRDGTAEAATLYLRLVAEAVQRAVSRLRANRPLGRL